MSTTTITVPFATTQRPQNRQARTAVTKAPGLDATTFLELRRSVASYATDTIDVLKGIAAYVFVFTLMFWTGAFLYAVL